MDLLLLRPRDPLTGTSFTRIRTLTLPAVAQEFMGLARVRVVDESVEPIPAGPFDLVGITCDTPRSVRAYELADSFRRRNVPVILGGTHPTAAPDQALQHADSVVLGEVEGLGATIVSDLAAGRLRPRYRLDTPPDLSAVPVPPVDLLPTYRQRFAPYPLELTRGCRHACRFCFNRAIHGPGFRRRPLAPLIDVLRTRPERLLLCMDDNIVNDPAHLGAFAEGVGPLGRRWGGQATLQLAEDPALLRTLRDIRTLRDSGFSWTFLGLESFSAGSLAAERKSFNRIERYRAQLGRLREHGVLPFLGVMLGLDGDGPEVFERTYTALQRLGPIAVAFTMPVAFPGTDFHARMEAEGRLLDRDATHYDGHHVVLRPLRLTPQQLWRGYVKLTRAFYRWRAALPRLLPYLARGTNLPRTQLVGGFAAITLGYRRFHRRLSRQPAPG